MHIDGDDMLSVATLQPAEEKAPCVHCARVSTRLFVLNFVLEYK